MGGKVPAEDMTPERNKLIEDVTDLLQNPSKNPVPYRQMLLRVVKALDVCPRMSCAFCEHQARSEAQRASVQNPE